MATYTTNDQLIHQDSGVNTYPDNIEAIAGTWTAGAGINVLIGVGGDAFSICGGDQGIGLPSTVSYGWIFDVTNEELRRISVVQSDNNIVLESGFTNAQSGATLYFVPSSRATSISVRQHTGGESISVDGVGINEAVPFWIDYSWEDSSNLNMQPLIVSGNALIRITYVGSHQ